MSFSPPGTCAPIRSGTAELAACSRRGERRYRASTRDGGACSGVLVHDARIVTLELHLQTSCRERVCRLDATHAIEVGHLNLGRAVADDDRDRRSFVRLLPCF